MLLFEWKKDWKLYTNLEIDMEQDYNMIRTENYEERYNKIKEKLAEIESK